MRGFSIIMKASIDNKLRNYQNTLTKIFCCFIYIVNAQNYIAEL
jgi:hypothetical protein